MIDTFCTGLKFSVANFDFSKNCSLPFCYRVYVHDQYWILLIVHQINSLMMRDSKEGKNDRMRASQPSLLGMNSAGSYTSFNRSMSIQTATSDTSIPRSALRIGKYTSYSPVITTPRAAIPIDFNIDHLSGPNALYEVLRIDRAADVATVRRAYLSQGRKCLAVKAGDAPRNLDDVPAMRRRRFQDISIAYEILSTPELRKDYDKYGIVCSLSPKNANELINPNNVRWKPYVEEKIIEDSHPDEHSRSSRSLASEDESSLSSGEEAPTEIDTYGWLQDKVRQFDEEADKFLSGTIIDKVIDEGFTGLQQSIGSIMKKTNKNGSKTSTHFQRQGTTVTNGHSQQYQAQQNQFTGATLVMESVNPRMKKQRSREKLQSQMSAQQSATNNSQGNKRPSQSRRDLEQQSRQDSEIDRTPFSVINKYMDHVSAAFCFSGSLNNEYHPRDDELRESTAVSS